MTDRTRRRSGTVVLAPAAALTAWALIRLSGIDLVVSTGDGTVGAVDVVVAALVGALGGWSIVRLLERHSRRPRMWWSFAGSTGLAMSVIGPAWFADGASAVALIVLHVVTAVAVLCGFGGTLPVYCGTQSAQPLPETDPAR
jgi:hypothetical protein